MVLGALIVLNGALIVLKGALIVLKRATFVRRAMVITSDIFWVILD